MAGRRLTYRAAGVCIDAGDEFVRRIRRSVASTGIPGVIGSFGGFAGLYRPGADRRWPRDAVLVACTDGVGTKVLVAAKLDRLDTVGIDLVAMNVNDMLTCGARPLFFLDYLAVDRLLPSRAARLVAGIARGCRSAGCALLGGETAEMPALYRRDDFDLAGFAVGVVGRRDVIDGRGVRPGDAVIGLASSGLHSNGYSLVREVLPRRRWSTRPAGLRGTLGEELLRPTRIYVRPVLELLARRRGVVKAMAHITGGGLPGNVPRALPRGCRAVLHRGSWREPAIFRLIRAAGVDHGEMARVFNLGIGLVIIVRRADAAATLAHFKRRRVAARDIGTIEAGKRGLDID